MGVTLIFQMIIFALLAIGILVTVHEYGHYIVAKKLGIKVLRFSVGFGKPIWSKTAGADQTEYVISRWPLGGYVKMLDERDCDVAPNERHRAFNRQPVFNRILVLVAGPLFNFLLAIVFFWWVFLIGVPGSAPDIGMTMTDSPAAKAGIEGDDTIVSVNGAAVSTWSEAHLALLDGVIASDQVELEVKNMHGARTRKVVLEDLGDRKALTEPDALMSGLGIVTWPIAPGLIGQVADDSPALRAGLMSGDVIVEINGEIVDNYVTITERLRTLPGEEIALVVERAGQRLDKSVVLASVTDNGQQVGRLGIAFGPSDEAQALWESRRVTRQYGVAEGLVKAGAETWNMSAMMLGMLGKMITGQVSVRNISGPLNIARFAGYTARQGPTYYLRFLALLSLSLGVLNLLPVPMLDGGQIVFSLAEGVKGSPLSMRAEIIGQQIGMAMLVVLMFFAISNDIMSIIG